MSVIASRLPGWPPTGVFAALEATIQADVDAFLRCFRLVRAPQGSLPPGARGPGVHESHVRPDRPIPVYPTTEAAAVRGLRGST